MRIAIVGSSGYIAKHLMKAFTSQLNDCEIMKIDMTDDADMRLQLTAPAEFDYNKLQGIDYVIFTAAISGPDMCANEFDKCWDINVTGTTFFIREAIKRDVRVLFFSSDAVFGDIPGHIYDEDSVTQAYTAYGKMKKAIEDEFKTSKFFKFTVSDVIKAILWLMQYWTTFDSFVLNLTGTELVSRVRMADEMNRYFGNKLKYTVTQPNEDFFKNRPQVTQMKSKYLYALNIIENKTFTEKFQEELKKIEL